MARLTIQAFICTPYLEEEQLALLTANPGIQCYGSDHARMLAWSIPFLAVFVVLCPVVIAGRMFNWRCSAGLQAWVRVDFLQIPYKHKSSLSPEGDTRLQTVKESCQSNYEIILLARRVCLTAVALLSDSVCQSSESVCLPQVVAVNAVLFGSVIVHTVVMPFKNRIHNRLEVLSLVLNFAQSRAAQVACY